MKRYSPAAAKQRGMAIISALLIAAVVAVLAGAMLTRQTVFTRSLEAEQLRIQGQWLLQGGLERSRQMLWDARQKDVLTRLDQPWARAQGGVFEGRIVDEQGKFNLRNLVNRQQVDTEQLQSFERLCRLIGVDPAVSRRISQRVIASYVPPAKYPMLRSLDDLSGIEGLDPIVLQRMQAYISVLPGPTWVNGNTASAEVLSAVVPQLSVSQAHGLVAERDGGHWFINRGDFVNRLRLPQIEVDSVQVGITSEWFRLQGQARREQRRVTIDALLHRPEDREPRVIWSRVGV
ncbi:MULTISPECIES: type II secretion system minor pseudopilin GspK [unclassified Pseudomonas]|uniref:type II secretion system minor pseudopilin GspK n=1 Tax=unclassified Pseudomonas TaxID=196821 RepID=UPI000812A9D4|nr:MULTISPECIES: type II secretion system minor pseudopilin GspK [unclassified Pseudomonas]CRM57607.1 Type II secretory pathway, component PulK [Pseudomonas sp. 58 R 12]CRM75327.1 Type II secretory pathway, component PulK [Pseudomonas sp. 52 E 6]